MLDDLDRLRDKPPLRELLAHYATLAKTGREVWQDRLMALDGADAAELSRLHGELIACDWVELNTASFGASKAGAITGCYRVTPAGLRALRQLRTQEVPAEANELSFHGTPEGAVPQEAAIEAPASADPPPTEMANRWS